MDQPRRILPDFKAPPVHEVTLSCHTAGYEGTPLWERSVVDALDHLLDLPDNWDSHGASRIARSIARQVLELLDRTAQPDTPAPFVVPTNQGGVQLEWHDHEIDIEVEIFPGAIPIDAYFSDARSCEEWEETLVADLGRLSKALRMLTARSAGTGTSQE